LLTSKLIQLGIIQSQLKASLERVKDMKNAFALCEVKLENKRQNKSNFRNSKADFPTTKKKNVILKEKFIFKRIIIF